jgi:hypothetical protein
VFPDWPENAELTPDTSRKPTIDATARLTIKVIIFLFIIPTDLEERREMCSYEHFP